MFWYATVKLLVEDERNQMLYEERQKEIRDEMARHDYALEQGLAQGLEAGISSIRKKAAKNLAPMDIADMLELEEPYVKDVLELLEKHPALTDLEIARLVAKR